MELDVDSAAVGPADESLVDMEPASLEAFCICGDVGGGGFMIECSDGTG